MLSVTVGEKGVKGGPSGSLFARKEGELLAVWERKYVSQRRRKV